MHVNAHATLKLFDTAVVMVALGGGAGHNVQSAVGMVVMDSAKKKPVLHVTWHDSPGVEFGFDGHGAQVTV